MSYSSAPRPVLDMHLNADHYSPYSSPDSPSPDEDENASLRSQALNADGTPKRPMNAFMIFARRRRPQVSAANQMMRTGEISKILSKEWNTMPMSDKQFYLDQAKKLKENFNAKYPDYVYRRRPNNSRKRRRPDASVRGVDAYGTLRDDSLSPLDHSPDYPHSASLSPIDPLVPNEHSVSLAAHQYRAIPYSAHSHYHPDPAAAAAAAASSSSYPYYSPAGHPPRHHPHYDTLPTPLSFPSAHSVPGIYHPDDDAFLASASSTFPRLEPLKLEQTWSSLSARRGALHPASLRPPQQQQSHPHHARHWSDGSAGGSTASPSAPAFPTLVAPFYPSSGTVSPSTASSSSAASYFGGIGTAAAAAASAGDDTPPQFPSPSQSQQQHHHQAQAQGRTYGGPTLGSTLALSPGATSGLWSSVRNAPPAAVTKSEL